MCYYDEPQIHEISIKKKKKKKKKNKEKEQQSCSHYQSLNYKSPHPFSFLLITSERRANEEAESFKD
jgi:hypothetical protein